MSDQGVLLRHVASCGSDLWYALHDPSLHAFDLMFVGWTGRRTCLDQVLVAAGLLQHAARRAGDLDVLNAWYAIDKTSRCHSEHSYRRFQG